jgi:single stranded DNA-binding protein
VAQRRRVRQVGEIIAQYVTKGSQIFIEGKIQTRKWQDKEGKDRYSTEIVAKSDGDAWRQERCREASAGDHGRR